MKMMKDQKADREKLTRASLLLCTGTASYGGAQLSSCQDKQQGQRINRPKVELREHSRKAYFPPGAGGGAGL